MRVRLISLIIFIMSLKTVLKTIQDDESSEAKERTFVQQYS